MLLITLAASSAEAKKIFDRDWIEVTTQNFTIHSTLDEAQTVELARFLEMFRIATAAVTNVTTIESPIPTNILVLADRADYREFDLPPTSAGVYMQSMRDNTIIMRDIRGDHEKTIIMHEYVHFLVRNQGTRTYPRWFSEGFAEYLSAAAVVGGVFELGRVPEMRRSSFRFGGWVPIRRVVGAKNYSEFDSRDLAMFYAESWALVHFLLNRPDRAFGQDMQTYLELIDSGVRSTTAFEKGFGLGLGQLNRDVPNYLNKGEFNTLRLSVSDILPQFSPQTRTLPIEEVGLVVGKVALRRGEYRLAEEAFEKAVDLESTRARAAAGLGDAFKFQNKHDVALRHFERAVQAAPDDPYVQLDAGEYWHDMARMEEDAALRKSHIDRARTHYLSAWRLDDGIAEVYAMLGESYTLLGDDHAKAVELLEIAAKILPSSVSIHFKLAEAYLDAGMRESASDRARLVLSWLHGESSTAKRAREIIEETEN